MILRASATHLPIRDETIQCVVTSPPYFGLRAYPGTERWWGGLQACRHEQGQSIRGDPKGGSGTPTDKNNRGEMYGRGATRGNACRQCQAWYGGLGLEPTPELYIQHLVEVFREVRRALRPDGTCWLNLGDSYAGSGKGLGSDHGKAVFSDGDVGPRMAIPSHLKPKDLCGIPWRVAFALQADGWWLRQAITWCKKAAMPESVSDRPSSATEMIFLLSKCATYYYDRYGYLTPYAETTVDREDGSSVTTSNPDRPVGFQRTIGHPGANLKNFWLLSPEPQSEAHFATFPSEIPLRAILLGTSAKGCCPTCGAPWARAVKREITLESGSGKTGRPPQGKWVGSPQAESGDYDIRMGPVVHSTTLGWRPTCACAAGDPVPCTVLDPFLGSGTVGRVAESLGRRWVGCDLSYHDLAKARVQVTRGLPL